LSWLQKPNIPTKLGQCDAWNSVERSITMNA